MSTKAELQKMLKIPGATQLSNVKVGKLLGFNYEEEKSRLELEEALNILEGARRTNAPAGELLGLIYDVSHLHLEVAEALCSQDKELEALQHIVNAVVYLKATLNPRIAGMLYRQMNDALLLEPARIFIYEQPGGKYGIASRLFSTLGEAITYAKGTFPWKAIKFEPLLLPKEEQDGQKDGQETKTGQASAAARRAETRGPVKA